MKKYYAHIATIKLFEAILNNITEITVNYLPDDPVFSLIMSS